MSGEIAFHIQEDILRRLPVKSLFRFRSVCKAWRRLIESSYFIAAHTARQDQWQQLFVRHLLVGGKANYVCIVDDDTFPRQRFVPTLPLSIQQLQRSSMVGNCNGLVCLNGYYDDSHSPLGKPMFVIWNPSIGKSIAIAMPEPDPGMSHKMDETAFGFGVCPVTHDPKIVMISQLASLNEKPSKLKEPRKVMLYTLSSGKWTSLSTNVPNKSVRVRWNGEVIDGFMYWSGSHMKAINSRLSRWSCNLILSFDLTNHIFQVINLPDSLAKHPPSEVSISKLREFLVIFEGNEIEKNCDCGVWMMENKGVEKLFTKVFTIIDAGQLGHWDSGTMEHL